MDTFMVTNELTSKLIWMHEDFKILMFLKIRSLIYAALYAALYEVP